MHPPRTEHDRQRAKSLLVFIVRAGSDGILGRARLYKAFYAAHVIYLRDHGRALTPWPLVHMPYGPGVDEGDALLQELESERAVLAERALVGPYAASRYRPGPESSRYRLDEAPAAEAVTKAVTWVEARSTAQLTADTHDFSRSWQATRDGEELPIALDTMSDDEYATAIRSVEAAKEDLGALFPTA